MGAGGGERRVSVKGGQSPGPETGGSDGHMTT